jgi:hypothetical protein
MNSSEDAEIAQIRKKKQTVGVVAIVLLMVFTILALTGVITSFEWLIADLIVAVIANIILKSIGKPKL